VSDEGKVGIETSFLHASGTSFPFGKLMVKAENLTAQQVGGALTYIRRQSIQTACGISVDLDDDGNRASTPSPIPQAATRTGAEVFGQTSTLKQTTIPGTNNAR
jgi:hypothetical protein